MDVTTPHVRLVTQGVKSDVCPGSASRQILPADALPALPEPHQCCPEQSQGGIRPSLPLLSSRSPITHLLLHRSAQLFTHSDFSPEMKWKHEAALQRPCHLTHVGDSRGICCLELLTSFC